MISINKQGNAIVIEFTDNDKYLFNGKIEVAPNELIVVTDDSEMATFKKASNGDVLFSQLISDIQIAGSPVTKDTIIDQFATIGFISGGGSGEGAVSSVNGQTGDVVITADSLNVYNKTEIDSALEGKQGKLSAGYPLTLDEQNNLYLAPEGYATKEELADKQDTLVSGTTIKTINGNSILGEGNIEITGGGSSNKTWNFTGATDFLTGDTSSATLTVASGTVSYGEVSVGDIVVLDDDYNFIVLNKYADVYGRHITIMPLYNTTTNDSKVLGYVIDLQEHATSDAIIKKATLTSKVYNATAAEDIRKDTTGTSGIALSGFSGFTTAKPGDIVHITYSNKYYDLVVTGKYYNGVAIYLALSGLGDNHVGYTIDSRNYLHGYIPSGGTVDTTMSDTSENAVQNKVIKAYVDGLVGDINSVLTRING